MAEAMLILQQIIWTVCAFVPAVMLIVLKCRKQASVRIFFKGAALSFVIHLMQTLYILRFNSYISVQVVVTIISLLLFYCVYHEDDAPEEVRSLMLGAVEIMLLYWSFIFVMGTEIWRTDPGVEITNDDIPTAIKLIVWALVQTVVVMLGVFGIYKLYGSEKFSARKKVVFSTLITVLLCNGWTIIGSIAN